MDRVVAYIDGFNLYFGLKAEHGRKYLWLDLQGLVEGLLLPNQELREVQYFTARVRGDPEGERRQGAYLDALASHCQKVRRIDGRFQEKTRFEGAALDAYDTALLISGDTDLRPAIASVKRLQPEKLIFAAFPPRRYSARLVQSVDAYTRIGHDKIRNAQLPHEVMTKGGITLNRPEYWR